MDWQIAYLKAVGAPITGANVKFLNTWQRYEGGATNNDATNNYLNTTWGKGFKSINGVGVKAYPTLDVGAQAFASTLTGNRDYGGLLQGLHAGDPYKYASRVTPGLETWVSGNPSGNPGYAAKILGGTATPEPQPAASGVPAAPVTSGPSVADTVFQNVGAAPADRLRNLVMAVAAGANPGTPGAPVAASPPSVPTGATPKPGVPVVGLTSVGGEHPTEGLAGYPAHDYFAKAGSAVVAPVAGTVVRLSGHNPKVGPTEGPHGPFGWSVYIKGTNGKVYFLTHLGSRDVQVGEKLAVDQPIGTVGNYAKYGTPSHVHMGVHG